MLNKLGKVLVLSIGIFTLLELTSYAEVAKPVRKTISSKVKQSVVAVLEANESLHSAFFEYNAMAVEKHAKNLINMIDKIKSNEISKLLVFSKSKLSEIKSSNGREANNQAYHLVSMALIHIVSSYDIDKKYKAFYCPMEQKKWIQNTEKLTGVNNPYAPSMPHCGSSI